MFSTSSFKKFSNAFLFLAIMGSLFYITVLNTSNMDYSVSEPSPDEPPSDVNILFWTEYFESKILKILPKNLVINTNRDSSAKLLFCPNAQLMCKFTTSKDLVTEADAVVFHARNVHWLMKETKTNKVEEVLPLESRREDQPWVFFHQESPLNTELNLYAFNRIFNWTMTYRSDSDIPFPYGKFRRKLVKDDKSQSFMSQHYLNRTKKVAWTVSNCKAKAARTVRAKILRKLIPVDIYGACGNLTCPNPNRSDGCHKFLEKHYKFYLAFENSLCDEYVTEKFFNTLKSEMIPVVFGLADYARIAPPKSFINVRDFETIAKLAEYLLWLDANPEEYAKYFEWKRDFEVVQADEEAWCGLCEKVAEERESGWATKKWYEDLHAWFFGKVPNKLDLELDANSTRNQMMQPSSACVKKI